MRGGPDREVAPEGDAAPAPRVNPDLIGHESIERDLRRLFEAGRLPHALLLSGPRGMEQECLGERVPALVGAVKQQPADRLGALGAAGLAGPRRGDAGAGKRRHQKLDLGRLAGPLPALDGNETTARAIRAP